MSSETEVTQRAPAALSGVAKTSPRPSASATATVSDRALPILISTFRGSLDLASVQRHDDEVREILHGEFRRKRPVVYIVDARGVAVPSAVVRRHWAHRVNAFRSDLDTLLGTFIVLDNPLVRGALTAITWMTNAGDTLHYSPSLENAVERANATLGEHGHPGVQFNRDAHSVFPARD